MLVYLLFFTTPYDHPVFALEHAGYMVPQRILKGQKPLRKQLTHDRDLLRSRGIGIVEFAPSG
jgi:hypothetical protein